VRCVKKECVYKVYEKRGLDPRQMLDSLDSMCKDCFRCVQNCPNRLIEKGINPSYKALGDEYWTPEIISCLWFQAETGRIPVSGGGYGGPFSGPGFDAMWTDMSEIVRPTRDGIHGREYISTSVDIGRKPSYLSLNGTQSVASLPPLVSLPMPLIIDLSSPAHTLPKLDAMIEQTAGDTGLIAIMNSSYRPANEANLKNIAFYLGSDSAPVPDALLKKTRLVEIA